MRFDPLGPEGQAYADRVRERQPDVVFLCVGMPKQEHWVLHHAGELPGGILLCVGAAMEFAIGLQRRAPLWMQRIGLEWLWRLASNPRRLWRRYLVDDPRFLGPVSYTHLDVYKRQPRAWRACSAARSPTRPCCRPPTSASA